MDRYFFYNTDAVDEYHKLTGEKRRIHVLFDKGIAASGGDQKFGEQLGVLDRGDTLLMYENGTGIIGLGTVRTIWDGKTYRRPWYYPGKAPGANEYRIAVDWDAKVSESLLETPITLLEIRRLFASPKFRVRGYHSAILRIVKHHNAAAKLVEDLRTEHGSVRPSDVARDIANSAMAHKDEPTTARREIESRLGQGRFRNEVLELWQHRCAVTGSSTIEAIRASHIKPWSEFPELRLDSHNGIPLIATLDALFDKGLISFDARGRMLLSEKLSDEERGFLGVSKGRQIDCRSKRTATYLEWHREHFGFES